MNIWIKNRKHQNEYCSNCAYFEEEHQMIDRSGDCRFDKQPIRGDAKTQVCEHYKRWTGKG